MHGLAFVAIYITVITCSLGTAYLRDICRFFVNRKLFGVAKYFTCFGGLICAVLIFHVCGCEKWCESLVDLCYVSAHLSEFHLVECHLSESS